MFPYLHHNKKRKKAKAIPRGFLMMYAILFITVVLTIAMGILDISLKQFSISSISRESSRALYAADAALECVLYGDQYKNFFATTTTETKVPLPTASDGSLRKNSITLCEKSIDEGNTVDLYTPNPNPGSNGSILWSEPYNTGEQYNGFKITFGSGTDMVCATVMVEKVISVDGDISKTIIDSRGYNTNCPDPDNTPAIRLPRVERGLKATIGQ